MKFPTTIDKNSSGVYQILNKNNNKIYIGSSINLYRRFISHKNKLRKNIHPNQYLQNSYNKHGEEAFTFEILKIVKNDNNLIAWEQTYLDKILPESRYNIQMVANSSLGLKRSKATRKKVADAHRGKKLSKSHRENISRGLKGKSKSQESIKKFIEAMSKPIYRVSIESGEVILYKSAKIAAKETGMKRYTICAGSNRDSKVAGKYLWIKEEDWDDKTDYVKEYFNIKEKHKLHLSKTKREAIYQLDIETGKIKNKFDSIEESQRCTKLRHISHKNEMKVVGGYLWVYADRWSENIDYKKLYEDYLLQQKINRSNAMKKYPVYQLDMAGNILGSFDSPKDAEIVTGACHVGLVCKGYRKTAGGYGWIYQKDYSKP